MTIDIDNLTDGKSLEEIEELLNDIEIVDEVEQQQEQTSTEEKVETTATTAAEGKQGGSEEGQDSKQDAGEEQQQADGAEKVVLSKDGKNTIPYEVLAHERAQAKQLREENAQLRQAAAERDELAAKLEKEGISLTEQQVADLTPEQLDELAEDYPGIAPVIKILSAKLNAIESTSRQSTPATNPVEAALNAVPDLVAWRDGDEDRFTFAVTVDQRLMSDPAWKDKPMQERFEEAARRTRAAFGDEVKQQTAKPDQVKEPQAKTKIPDSPSDLGSSAQATNSNSVEALSALPLDQLTAKMGSMSSDQIEALLAQL